MIEDNSREIVDISLILAHKKRVEQEETKRAHLFMDDPALKMAMDQAICLEWPEFRGDDLKDPRRSWIKLVENFSLLIKTDAWQKEPIYKKMMSAERIWRDLYIESLPFQIPVEVLVQPIEDFADGLPLLEMITSLDTSVSIVIKEFWRESNQSVGGGYVVDLDEYRRTRIIKPVSEKL